MRISSTLASLGVGLLAIGSVASGQQTENSESFSFTKNAGSRQRLVVTNTNGRIAIVGVPGANNVRISGVKMVNSGSGNGSVKADDITIDIEETGDAIEVTTNPPRGGRNLNYTVDYTIEIPGNWSVQVTNSNGNVIVEGVQKGVKVDVANGTVEAKNVGGDIEAEVANGTIRGSGKIPDNGSCRLRTSNGTIDARLEMASSVSCDIVTSNGKIVLALPKNTSAGVSATTGIGKVSVDGLEFASKTRDQQNMIGETFTGTLGGGSGKITLAVQNGSIALKGF